MPVGQLCEHGVAFARDVVALLLFSSNSGYEVRISEVFRPEVTQRHYVKTGRSKTMNSMHRKKCAGDLYFTEDNKLVYPKELGEYWESLNPLNQAGMFWKNFKDKPHYQRTV